MPPSRANGAAAATIIAITAVYANRRVIREQLRFLMTKFLDATRHEPAIAARQVTGEFWNQDIDEPVKKTRHSHGQSAAQRSAAVTAIRVLNLKLGVQEASVSMSTSDQKHGLKGTRSYFWAKDVDKAPRSDTDGCALTYVDVDFHVDDLESTLAGRAHHTTIFTVVPREAASSGESSHTFNNDGTISVNVSGGAEYTHHLWDWTPDTLTCSRRFLGFPYLTTTYRVEKRSMDHLKAIVVLAPTGTWSGFAAIIASNLQSARLQRFNCIQGDFAHIRHVSETGLRHSIARTGAHTAASVTAEQYDTMVESALAGKQKPTTSAMATWCDQNRVHAIIMAAYLTQGKPASAPYVTAVEDSVISVSANVNRHGDQVERVSVQPFMQPIVGGNCHAHTDHQDNADWAAYARITSVAAPKPQQLNPFVAACISDFVKLTFPEPLCQADLQTVYDKQNRASQRAIIAEAVDAGPSQRTSLKAFLKKEAYGGEKDPRIITTYGPGAKVGYSVYMYAVADQLKRHNWYGFKTPEQVAARVAQICSSSEYVIEGDFSRMDGRVDKNVREAFEKAILRTIFPGDDEVIRLHQLQYGQTVQLGSTSYDQGFARGSGSPETSVFNTTLTAFVSYLASRIGGQGSDEAFATIGIVAGDDSLKPATPNARPEAAGKFFVKAARQMGQKLTSDIKTIGQPVQFLARVFGGAWYGDMNSMASPLRLLSKVHACVNIGVVPPEDKCREKGESILPGDGNTPIIGELARKMTTVGQRLKGDQLRAVQNWWSHFDDCSWPNEYDTWMEEVISAELPEFDYDAFNAWIEDGEALQAPTCFTVKPKTHERLLMVNGEPNRSIGKPASLNGATKGNKSRQTYSKRKRTTSVKSA